MIGALAIGTIANGGELPSAPWGHTLSAPAAKGIPQSHLSHRGPILRAGAVRVDTNTIPTDDPPVVGGVRPFQSTGGQPWVPPMESVPTETDGNAECDDWGWHFLPPGLIYHSYLAGEKEPRFGSSFLHQTGRGWLWEVALGGRVGILRYGNLDVLEPDGFQIDLEGAALPQLDLEQQEDVDAVDFRFGLVGTWRSGKWAFKSGYYHISSHVGDEYLVKHPTFQRINYVRESLLFGAVYNITTAMRVYGEVAYAVHVSGGAEPWEFQFGFEYSPLYECSSPFFAINGHLREEVDFGGSVNVMTGWQWRSLTTGHLFRLGLQYYNGKAIQYSFFPQNQELIGFGIWLDF